ncbi:MAG: hypothetical protein JWQ95_6342 [Sphaerisporangium sp.]|jgi:hypothetical protein|nr:hypothetical protein [Sphaerisporangium sp.]
MATSSAFVPHAPPLPPSRTKPPSRRAPVWRRLAGAVLGLALASAAVYAQTFVMTADDRRAPLTVSGGMHGQLNTDHFSARLERVEFARSVRVKSTYGTDEATTDQLFLIVKIGATSPRRPVKLVSHILTSDGLRFEATDHVNVSATLGDKWVQPGWWRSGFYFFEIPPDKVAGARVVVSEMNNTVYGDQYAPEVSFDLGLDGAKARQMTDAAKDVYEVSG